MLVLSRRENQCVVFPNLGITVEILRVAGNTVRVGVSAPRSVHVLRGELTANTPPDKLERPDGKRWHELRNLLNSAQLALHLLQKQLAAGRHTDAEKTLDQALESFAHLDRLAIADGALPDSRTQSESANPRRALVVEDNANERELLAGYLRLCGYDVAAVEDGLAALGHLSRGERPQAIFLDMQMPRMDGRQTISAIRGNPDYRNIKLFAISGADPDDWQIPVGDRGVDRWFAKPLQPAQFASEIDAELRRDLAVR